MACRSSRTRYQLRSNISPIERFDATPASSFRAPTRVTRKKKTTTTTTPKKTVVKKTAPKVEVEAPKVPKRGDPSYPEYRLWLKNRGRVTKPAKK